MKNVAVLGAGLVGSLVAKDLAADGRWAVLSVDRSALSSELSKLRREGVLEYTKNNFTFKQPRQG